MIAKRLKRPRDPVQLGKLIGDILTGQVEDHAPDRPENSTKDQAAVALGRKGGLKGGKARAAKMTPKRRAEIARQAAKASARSSIASKAIPIPSTFRPATRRGKISISGWATAA
jgi:hypothetical protein